MTVVICMFTITHYVNLRIILINISLIHIKMFGYIHMHIITILHSVTDIL